MRYVILAVVTVAWHVSPLFADAPPSVLLISSDADHRFEVGQPVTFHVELAGLGEGRQLDSLSATVDYDGDLLGVPAISSGHILPDMLDDPLDFVASAYPGQADATFLTFGADTENHIVADGIFFSFEVIPLAEGTGIIAFNLDGVDATWFDPQDPWQPVLLQAAHPTAFTVVPEPTSAMLGLSGLALAGLLTGRPRRKRSENRPRRRLKGEVLESRKMLSAGNIAEFVGWVDGPDEAEHFEVSVSPEAISLKREAGLFGLQVTARSGSDFDADVVRVTGPDGQAVASKYSRSDVAGGTDSVAIFELAAGDHIFSVIGEEDSWGPFQLDVFLVGDANGDHVVDSADARLIRSSYGAESGQDEYCLAADANLDGRITAFDLTQWKRNARNSSPPPRMGPLTYAEFLEVASTNDPSGLVPAGGVFDKVPAIVPQSGYDPAAAMRFFESEIGLVQPLPSYLSAEGGIFEVPGTSGSITVTFTWEYREAGYDNEVGIYFVNDTDGSVSALDSQDPDLEPGDTGYTAAALTSSNVDVIFSSGTDPNSSGPVEVTRDMSPGTRFSFYMVQDDSTTAAAGGTANVWFALQDANADDYAHFQETESGDSGHQSDCLSLKIEDLRNSDTGIANAPNPDPNGSPFTSNDMDFNDVVISYDDQTDAPRIVDFRAYEGPTAWTFDGTVIDDGDTEGLEIVFGGILVGETAEADSDGGFYLSLPLEEGIYGTATAYTTDTQGLESNVAMATI